METSSEFSSFAKGLRVVRRRVWNSKKVEKSNCASMTPLSEQGVNNQFKGINLLNSSEPLKQLCPSLQRPYGQGAERDSWSGLGMISRDKE